MQCWLVPILTTVLGVVVGAILTYYRMKHLQKAEHEHEEKIAIIGKNYKEIVNFVTTNGVRKIVDFFDENSPDEIFSNLQDVSKLIQFFEKREEGLKLVKSELWSLRSLLSERLFNPVTGRIHEGIESNLKFVSRLQEKDESKKYLKDNWLNLQIVQDVLRTEDSIFIESGSTLAYCMLSMIDKIPEYRQKPPLRVCTNNVAIYMMLLFQEHFDPVLLPGKPDNPYAATFADISDSGSHGNEINDFLEANNVNVLFTTASYLDIDYGPHVGSIQNHAMKRILYNYARGHENRKNIFVIVAENINKDVRDNNIDERCKLIFDPNRTIKVVDNDEVLKKTKHAWEDYLSIPQSYIISGSINKKTCDSKIENFHNHHKLDPFVLANDNGEIFQISSHSY